jgi:cellobionic acid phosphorylase
MREDIGRVTQKFPGSAENGSVYNHAAAFYIAALFHSGRGQQGYALLRKMLPGPDASDIEQRGQLPVFIPNYYRGAYRQHPRTAGRSSQLVNTGTVAWLYRTLVEQLFGLRGEGEALRIAPQIPAEWKHARAVRRFRGATIELEVRREATCGSMRVSVDGVVCAEASQARIHPVQHGRVYRVEVLLPS